jgi:hypothetical protein
MVGRRLFAHRKGYCPSSSEQVPETLVVDDERRRIRLLVPVELGLKNVKRSPELRIPRKSQKITGLHMDIRRTTEFSYAVSGNSWAFTQLIGMRAY